jgi:hypothetical protein
MATINDGARVVTRQEASQLPIEHPIVNCFLKMARS